MNAIPDLLRGLPGISLLAPAAVAGVLPSAVPAQTGFARTLGQLHADALEEGVPALPQVADMQGEQQPVEIASPVPPVAVQAPVANPAPTVAMTTVAASDPVGPPVTDRPLRITVPEHRASPTEGTGAAPPDGKGLPLSAAPTGNGLPVAAPATARPALHAATQVSAGELNRMPQPAASTPHLAGTPPSAEPLPPTSGAQAELQGVAAASAETPARAGQATGAAAQPPASQPHAVLPAADLPTARSAVEAGSSAAAMAAGTTIAREALDAVRAQAANGVRASASPSPPAASAPQQAAPAAAAQPVGVPVGEAVAPQSASPASDATQPGQGRTAMPSAAVERPPVVNAMADGSSSTEPGASDAASTHRRPLPDMLAQAMQSLLRQGLPAAEAGAAAGILDRRAMLEAAARHAARHESAASPADAVDRLAASTNEPADAPRQPGPRLQAPPPVPGRDLAALAERIEMLVHRRAGTASVSLSLSELGDVEVTVRMHARQAHLQFVVHDAAARDAMESALPRLRNLLEQSGLSLGDVAMNQSGQSGAGADRQRPGRAEHAPARPPVDAVIPEPETLTRRAAGSGRLLDAFA